MFSIIQQSVTVDTASLFISRLEALFQTLSSMGPLYLTRGRWQRQSIIFLHFYKFLQVLPFYSLLTQHPPPSKAFVRPPPQRNSFRRLTRGRNINCIWILHCCSFQTPRIPKEKQGIIVDRRVWTNLVCITWVNKWGGQWFAQVIVFFKSLHKKIWKAL